MNLYIPEIAQASVGIETDNAVGAFRIGDRRYFLPVSMTELARYKYFMSRILSTFHFRTGGGFLVTSLCDDFAQFMPMERAAMDLGFVVCSADDSSFDAARVESILRRFDIKAVATVSNACLDGLQNLGFDIYEVLGERVVWAYPDACHRLEGSAAMVRRFAMIGPAVAMECASGNGLHLDRFEWAVESRKGEIYLSSQMPRAVSFEALPTRVNGKILEGVCSCGNADPRIEL